MPRAIEKWKPIQGYELLYTINDKGRIKNIRTARVLKGKVSKKGYHRVNLSKNGQLRTFTVHCLVARHFIPNSENLQEVNHINENKLDNRVENLEWCDRKYNVNFGSRTERQREKLSKPVVQFTRSGEALHTYPSIIKAAQENLLSNSNISACCKGARHTCGGYRWQYATGGLV